MLLAQVFGYYLVITGVAVFLNRERFAEFANRLKKRPAMLFFTGALLTLAGLFLVLLHNIWVADWTVLVTIFAWGTLLKGMALMIAPDAVVKGAQAWKNPKLISAAGVIALIIGVYMLYMSYGL